MQYFAASADKLVNNVINIVAYFSVANCWTRKFVLLDFRYRNMSSRCTLRPVQIFNFYTALCACLTENSPLKALERYLGWIQSCSH